MENHNHIDPFNPDPKAGGFDSEEERFAYLWCMEGSSAGLFQFQYHPDPIRISDAADFSYHVEGNKREFTRSIFKPQVYSPDFKITWNLDACQAMIGCQVGKMPRHLQGPSTVWWMGSQAFASPGGPKKKTMVNEFIMAAPEMVIGTIPIVTYLEVKGAYNQNQRSLAHVYKGLWHNRGIIIHEANVCTKAGGFFDRTWTPAQFLLTAKTLKPRTMHYQPRMLKDLFGVALPA
jgi:hypothetical protein